MKVGKGTLFVLSSPSGGGKSTIIRRLLDRNNELAYSISATTRAPRKGEKDGIAYFFLDEKDFKRKIGEEAFVEWAEVHGYFYGTLKKEMERLIDADKKVLLDIDVQGGLALKKSVPTSILIFLMPPSLKTLERRLEGRGTDSEDVIAKRLENARVEMEAAERYDYQVWNHDLDKTVEEVEAIIHSFE